MVTVVMMGEMSLDDWNLEVDLNQILLIWTEFQVI